MMSTRTRQTLFFRILVAIYSNLVELYLFFLDICNHIRIMTSHAQSSCVTRGIFLFNKVIGRFGYSICNGEISILIPIFQNCILYQSYLAIFLTSYLPY